MSTAASLVCIDLAHLEAADPYQGFGGFSI